MSNPVLDVSRTATVGSPGVRPRWAVLNRRLRADDPTPLPVALVAAALCLAVGIAHVQDQGGFLGDVSPDWMKAGYYAVEVVAALTIPFLVRQKLFGWVLGALVSIGPFVGYIASRTVGVPGDPGDVGNWNYTLGTVSLVVEGLLFVLSITVLVRSARSARSAIAG